MTATALITILSIIVVDGTVAAAVGLASVGIGLWAARALGLHREPLRWQLLIGAGLGAGLLAMLVLTLGAVGALSTGAWWAIVAAAIAAGVVRAPSLIAEVRRAPPEVDSATGDSGRRIHRWCWLAVVPFASLAISAATCPPGYLWPAEGNGYDVLEYHFGGPREWFDAGRVTFLPHNIYTNFPQNAEMLYLLSFVLHGSATGGVYTAQLVNVLLGMLAVGGAWLTARAFGRLPGVVAGLTVATCPMLTYLSGVAYVENGMLAMLTLSLACVSRGLRQDDLVPRWAMAGGLLAGLAGGFKYTALPLGAVPLALACGLGRRGRTRAVLTFAGCAAAAFAPWAVRNIANTSNPVFPLARTIWPERPGIWSDEAAARWVEGHRPAPDERSARGRLRALGERVAVNRLYGPALALALLLSVAVLARRRAEPADAGTRRVMTAGLTVSLLIAAGWTMITHLVDRFAIGLLAPAALLTGVVAADHRRLVRTAAVGVVLGAAGWNLRTLSQEFSAAGVFTIQAFGATHWMLEGQWPGTAHLPRLREICDGGGRVLVVGDARALYLPRGCDYHVVFSRNPFAEHVAAWRSAPTRTESPAAWLTERGYSHLYVDWSEVRRLSRSRYGFWPGLAELSPTDYETMGLQPVEHFTSGERTYATLFSTRPRERSRAAAELHRFAVRAGESTTPSAD